VSIQTVEGRLSSSGVATSRKAEIRDLGMVEPMNPAG